MIVTEISTRNLETVARLIDEGQIKPCLGKVCPLSEVAQAWRDRRSEHVEGKIFSRLAHRESERWAPCLAADLPREDYNGN